MKYAIHTFGCKVNQYESAVISDGMKREGFSFTEDIFSADVVIINSCSVTEHSDKKAAQLIKKLKSRNPLCVIVLAGCMSQAFPEKATALPADIIIGTEGKAEIAKRVLGFINNTQRFIDIPKRPVGKSYELTDAADMKKTRAFIKIEDGCDRFCSYCIIPTARGSVRSRPIEDIVAETKKQVDWGHKEIVLVGINLSCYGMDFGLRLADAVEAVAGVEGVIRIRLSSLEPEMMTEEDVKRLSAIPQFCPHFHLSLQSGSANTLKRMNRHYSPSEYKEIVDRIRRYFPDCAITTDVMVGFAGETDEEFIESYNFVRDIGFSGVHVFTYSVRPGTAAEKLGNFVSSSVAAERYKKMSELAQRLKSEFYINSVGKTAEVLIQRKESEEYSNGLTPNYIPVRIYGSKAQRHDIVRVKITSSMGGEYVTAEEIKQKN